MGSCRPSDRESEAAASAEFRAAFRARAGGEGPLSFADFMALALYHPEVGYYRRPRERVGYGAGTDFFTSSTSGALFGELVAAAAQALLGGRDPKAHFFVEIGAEPGRSVLAEVAHPFAGVRTVRAGEPLALTGPCVVFSNELFDAQPFRRFIFRGARWRERGVSLTAERLREVEFETRPLPEFPMSPVEGYAIDAPLAATKLMEAIAREPWTGVFIACDYGKTWHELAECVPAGTARAYYRHTQSNDLLARPGEQDLTCHVCWDWLQRALQQNGFSDVAVDSQESFFVRHAGAFLAAVSAAEATGFSRRKQALLQLLHPAHLGQKFQVLHAVR